MGTPPRSDARARSKRARDFGRSSAKRRVSRSISDARRVLEIVTMARLLPGPRGRCGPPNGSAADLTAMLPHIPVRTEGPSVLRYGPVSGSGGSHARTEGKGGPDHRRRERHRRGDGGALPGGGGEGVRP